jgi:SanA protein
MVAFTNYWIVHLSEPFIYADLKVIPSCKVALVPGTSSKMASGSTNMFFKYRLQAVSDLYQAGKIQDIIVSGDNGSVYYNEPMEMKKALVELGVPDSCIYLDYAGFRTFDSVIRAWKIFGQKKFIFVSQRFQNERAVFIGRKFGLEITAYNAQDVSQYSGFKTNVREVFARVKVFLDIYVLNQQPRFLGEPVTIE